MTVYLTKIWVTFIYLFTMKFRSCKDLIQFSDLFQDAFYFGKLVKSLMDLDFYSRTSISRCHLFSNYSNLLGHDTVFMLSNNRNWFWFSFDLSNYLQFKTFLWFAFRNHRIRFNVDEFKNIRRKFVCKFSFHDHIR